jgi:hypothetical protein
LRARSRRRGPHDHRESADGHALHREWEHAFLLDSAPADRARHIEALFANVDWSAAESRLPLTASR